MHMGAMACAPALGLANLRHVLLNNAAHESVGGQATASSQQPHGGRLGLDFAAVAAAAGYAGVGSAATAAEMRAGLQGLAEAPAGRSEGGPSAARSRRSRSRSSRSGPRFLEVRTRLGTRDGLGRPRHSTADAKVTQAYA